MKFRLLAFALALMASTSAFAFPPTATTSPGYDRALAESRRARQMDAPVVAPAPRNAEPRYVKRRYRR